MTTYGKVEGVDDTSATGTFYWKGIPFAAPPVGELRWQPPVEPAPWGMRATKTFGAACAQTGRVYSPGANNTFDETVGTTLGQTVGSEDCLTLNIWRPASTEKDLPVIVFLHGGSNVSGYTADPLYDGAALARSTNAVVVTANYRLGAFGFLKLRQLATGTDPAADSGNFALLDHFQALSFVQRNITSFGGDKNNVTVMGQSAGAVNLWAMIASPLSQGLFHKAVPLSGGISLPENLPPGAIPIIAPASTSEALADSILRALLIQGGVVADEAAANAYIASHTNAELATWARSVPADALLQSVARAGLGGAAGPIPEGAVVPVNPIASISRGEYTKMPILAATTAEEGKSFSGFLAASPLLGGKPGIKLDTATLFTLQYEFSETMPDPPTVEDIVDPTYIPVNAPFTGYDARTTLLTNLLAIPLRNNVLDTLKEQQSDVYCYSFAWKQNPAPWNDVFGAGHGYDIPFLFGNFGRSILSSSIVTNGNAPGRLALSEAMMKSLAAFVRTGNPNHAGLGVTWEPWPKKLVFDASLTDKRISLVP